LYLWALQMPTPPPGARGSSPTHPRPAWPGEFSLDQAYAGFAWATKRADARVGYCLATAVHIGSSLSSVDLGAVPAR
jgi:hypothetical protein